MSRTAVNICDATPRRCRRSGGGLGHSGDRGAHRRRGAHAVQEAGPRSPGSRPTPTSGWSSPRRGPVVGAVHLERAPLSPVHSDMAVHSCTSRSSRRSGATGSAARSSRRRWAGPSSRTPSTLVAAAAVALPRRQPLLGPAGAAQLAVVRGATVRRCAPSSRSSRRPRRAWARAATATSVRCSPSGAPSGARGPPTPDRRADRPVRRRCPRLGWLRVRQPEAPPRPRPAAPAAARRPLAGLPRVLRAAGGELLDHDRPAHQRGLRLHLDADQRAARRAADARRGRLRRVPADVPLRGVRRVQGQPVQDARRVQRPDLADQGGARRAADPDDREGRLRGRRRHRHPDHAGRRRRASTC